MTAAPAGAARAAEGTPQRQGIVPSSRPGPPTARRALTVVPAPDSAPPVVDSPAPAGYVPEREPAQPMLPLLWAVPRPAVADESLAPGHQGDGGEHPRPPDIEAWVARLAAGVLEVLHGSRPAGQLVRWFDPRVHRALADRAARVRPLQDGPPRVAVRSVHVSMRTPERDEPVVVEAAAVVAVGPRCRAVALRLTPHAGRWRVTALEVG